MNVKYFNPETSNPQNYFWFNSFKPDVEIVNERNRLYNKTTGEIILTTSEELPIFGAPDPILSKILNAKVIYVDNTNMKKLIDFYAIDSEKCNNCLVINYKNYIFSIQINYGMGVKQIILNAKNYADVQAHYSIVYYTANKDKYKDYEDFEEKFANPVIEKYGSYYMRKFERLDARTKSRAIIG